MLAFLSNVSTHLKCWLNLLSPIDGLDAEVLNHAYRRS